jgi:hypothetical protein
MAAAWRAAPVRSRTCASGVPSRTALLAAVPFCRVAGALEHSLQLLNRRLKNVRQTQLEQLADTPFDLESPGAQRNFGLGK